MNIEVISINTLNAYLRIGLNAGNTFRNPIAELALSRKDIIVVAISTLKAL